MADDPNHPAYADGDVVSFTLPGGDVERFEFSAIADGDNFRPAFIPVMGASGSALTAWTVNGSGDPLDANGDPILLSQGDAGEYYEQSGDATIGYNPALSQFGQLFTLTTRSGIVYSISAVSGMVQTITDANGNRLDYSNFFGSSPTIVSEHVSGGTSSNVVTVSITRSSGQITAITDPGGDSIAYSYDSAGNLSGCTDRVGNVTTYAYGDPQLAHYLTAVNDPRGIASIRASYDDSTGQLLSLSDALGDSVPFTTGATGTAVGQTITNLGGKTTETMYDNNGNITRSIDTVLDGQGNIAGYNVTVHTYELDGNGQVQQVSDYQPFFVSAPDDGDERELDDPPTWALGQVTTIYTPSDPHSPSATSYLPDTVTVFGANDTARVTTYSGYDHGKPTGTTVVLEQLNTDGTVASSSTIASTSATYDSAGNMLTSTDAAGNVTDYAYTNGQLTETYYLNGSTHEDFSSSTYYSSTAAHAGSIAGMLASSTDANGRVTHYQYTADGNVSRSYYLYNGVWLVSTTVYDADQRPIATRQAQYTDGGTSGTLDMSSSTYDSDGYPTISESLVSGTSVITQSQTVYTAAAQTLYTTDQNGIRTYNMYDAKGNVVQTLYTHSSGLSLSGAANNGSGLIRLTTSSTSSLSTGEWIGIYGIFGTTEANGAWKITVIDSTHIDLQNSHFAHIYSSGGAIDVGDTLQRSVYDNQGRVVWQSDRYASGNTDAGTGPGTHTLYDSLGQVIGTERYTDMLIAIGSQSVDGVSVADSSLSTAGTLVSTTATYYDHQGRVVESDDAAGLRTGTTYYPNGQVQYSGILADGSPYGGTYTAGNYSSYSSYLYDKADSLPTGAKYYNSVTDPDGWTTKTYYDAMARVVQTTYPDGSYTQMLYGVYGTAVSGHTVSGQTIDGHQETQIDQLGNVTDNFYDRAGNLTDVYLPAVADALNSGTSTRPHWQYVYDASGNLTSTTDPKGNVTSATYDALGDQLTRALPLLSGQSTHATTTSTYNALGRQLTVVDFDGNTSVYSYYDNTSASAGMVSEIDYYASGKVPGTDSPAETVTYEYDALGNPHIITDSADAKTVNNYDNLNRLFRVDRYDPTGTTLWSTIEYVYDGTTNRLIETYTPTGPTYGGATDVKYGYTRQGQLKSVSIIRQNGSAPISVSGSTYYDAKGNALSTSAPTVLYTYDADGNITQISYPNGTETDYDYSSYWTHTSGTAVYGTQIVTNWRGGTSGTKLSQFTYTFDADRRKIGDLEYVGDSGEGLFSTTQITWGYDADSRLIDETYDYGNDDSGSAGTTHSVDDYHGHYDYDLDNNRVDEKIDNNDNGGGTTYDAVTSDTYNPQNELTAESQTPVGTTTATYSTTYLYDANGSLTQTSTTTGGSTTTSKDVYDVRNRLIRFDANGDTTYTSGAATGNTSDDTVYTYDDQDDRLSSKLGSSTAVTNVLDPNNPTGYTQILESWQGGTTPASSFLLGNQILEQDIGGSATSAGTFSFLMPDGHGSTRQLTTLTSSSGTNGHVTGRYDYDAFGNQLTLTAVTHAANTASTNVLYTGSIWDPEMGMYRMGLAGRDYSAAIGRFSTADSYIASAGDVANANPYAFVADNVLNGADPSGHAALLSTLGSMAITAGQYAQDLGQGMMVAGAAGMVASALTSMSASIGMALSQADGDVEGMMYYGALQAESIKGMELSAAFMVGGFGLSVLGSAMVFAGTALVALSTPAANLAQTGSGSFSASADEAYDAIRTSTTDVQTIAKNTGISEENIQVVKDHLFIEEHLLDRYVDLGEPAVMGRFDSDISIAQAWQRLENGVYTEEDIQLLKHETAEAWYMDKFGPGYSAAHDAAQARYPAPNF